ncbi:hypothetical protein GQ53DRAFT_822448 [Thozetella sp. PMI_491]|nr:hypothetical protein GQ53DRAFT_822448 [Thozetella sp. PMI_491]
METVDLEHTPTLTTTISSPSSEKRLSQLQTYQLLVGDISATESQSPNDESIYHAVVTEERKASVLSRSTGALFFLMVMAQIALCLGIAIGAQLGLNNNQVTILAGVNTGAAATIGILKGLGLPEKAALERQRLRKIAERIRLTTRKLKAGIDIDALKEADEVQRLEDEARDDAQINLTNIETAYKGGPK